MSHVETSKVADHLLQQVSRERIFPMMSLRDDVTQRRQSNKFKANLRRSTLDGKSMQCNLMRTKDNCTLNHHTTISLSLVTVPVLVIFSFIQYLSLTSIADPSRRCSSISELTAVSRIYKSSSPLWTEKSR